MSDSRSPSRVIGASSWLGVAVWMSFIFYLSSRTGISVWSPISYVAHFGEYVILALLLCVALSASTSLPRKHVFVLAVVIASLYGVSDELHQAFVPTREMSIVDWLTDTAGASAAILLQLAVTGINRGHSQGPERSRREGDSCIPGRDAS